MFFQKLLELSLARKKEWDNSSMTSTWLYLPSWCVHNNWLGSKKRFDPWEEMLAVGLNPLQNFTSRLRESGEHSAFYLGLNFRFRLWESNWHTQHLSKVTTLSRVHSKWMFEKTLFITRNVFFELLKEMRNLIWTNDETRLNMFSSNETEMFADHRRICIRDLFIIQLCSN